MNLSQIAAGISESLTLKLNAAATALREQGKPVIHLGGGEPKSLAPQSAIDYGIEMLKTGAVRYTPASGTPAMKQAIIDYTEKHYARRIEPANVLASSGAKQSIMVALQAVVDPGDEVLFPSPYWVSYPDMVKLCGGVPIPVPASDGSLLASAEDLIGRATPRTKAILINSPNNPSGLAFPHEVVGEIVRYCENNGVYLIMDDIYQRLVFDGIKPVNCYDYTKADIDSSHLIVINGVSKQYAMTGFRIGWAAAARKLTKMMGIIQGHQTSGPSALSQHAAVGALNGAQTSVEELRVTLQHNRDVLMEQLAAIPKIKVTKPDGTFYSFVDFRGYDSDSLRLAEYLIEQALVVTVPGVAFGMDGYLRISFCGSEEDIREGVGRIGKALASYPGGQ